MDPRTSVAARLAALGLDSRGRLSPQLIASAAVRAGLLVDLAAAGRLSLTEDSIELDTSPTGFPAADHLLLAMDAEPERTLDSWLDERRIGLEQVAASLVELGTWTRHRTLLGSRYDIGDPGQRDHDLHLGVEDDGAVRDAPTAAVAALAALANLVGAARKASLDVPPPAIPPAVLAAAGEQEWVLSAALDHLRTARVTYAVGANTLGSGSVYR
jgi:hypothetical protein